MAAHASGLVRASGAQIATLDTVQAAARILRAAEQGNLSKLEQELTKAEWNTLMATATDTAEEERAELLSAVVRAMLASLAAVRRRASSALEGFNAQLG